jgi:hypothetical protein
MPDTTPFEGKNNSQTPAINLGYDHRIRGIRLAKIRRPTLDLGKGNVIVDDMVEIIFNKHPVDKLKEWAERYRKEGLAPIIADVLNSIKLPEESDGEKEEKPGEEGNSSNHAG